jgi:hypothetical protein
MCQKCAGSAKALIANVKRCEKIDDALVNLLKVKAPAWAEYDKVKASAWAKLFSIKANRVPHLQ